MAADRGGWTRRKREVADGTGTVRGRHLHWRFAAVWAPLSNPEILILQPV